VGAGGSQDAAFSLKDSVRAGAYHCVLDSVIIKPVDVTFSLIWRRGSTDTSLVTWQKHFDPIGGGDYDAQPYVVDETAPAIDFQPGDQLVFRYAAGSNTSTAESYIPNGDGDRSNGRIPNITLPP
jgi:hypothetical protein